MNSVGNIRQVKDHFMAGFRSEMAMHMMLSLLKSSYLIERWPVESYIQLDIKTANKAGTSSLFTGLEWTGLTQKSVKCLFQCRTEAKHTYSVTKVACTACFRVFARVGRGQRSRAYLMSFSNEQQSSRG